MGRHFEGYSFREVLELPLRHGDHLIVQLLVTQRMLPSRLVPELQLGVVTKRVKATFLEQLPVLEVYLTDSSQSRDLLPSKSDTFILLHMRKPKLDVRRKRSEPFSRRGVIFAEEQVFLLDDRTCHPNQKRCHRLPAMTPIC